MADTREVVYTQGSNNGMGFFLGIVFLIVILFLFFYYGLPAIQNASQSPTIEVPKKVDVNVQQSK